MSKIVLAQINKKVDETDFFAPHNTCCALQIFDMSAMVFAFGRVCANILEDVEHGKKC